MTTRFPDHRAYALELLQKFEEDCDEEDRENPIRIIELDVTHGEHGYDFCAGGTAETVGGDELKFKVEESYWPGTFMEPPDYEINVAYLHWFEGDVKSVWVDGEAWRAADTVGVVLNIKQIIEKLFWLRAKQPYIVCSKPGWRVVARYDKSQVIVNYEEVPNVDTTNNQSNLSDVQDDPVASILGREAA